MEHLAIVTGVNNPIGTAYADALSCLPNTRVVGTSRSASQNNRWPTHAGVDLLSRAQVERFLDKAIPEAVGKITLLHTVGQFKFEDPPPPNGFIDPVIKASNLYTFENIVLGLVDRVARTPTSLSLCMLGSVSDVYQVPFWKSFTKSKNLMRALISRTIADNTRSVIKGLSIDICSIETTGVASEESMGRLTVPELIEQSMPEIAATIAVTRSEFRRINILRHAPDAFDWKRYYSDPEAIRERWKDRISGFDKPVPLRDTE